MNKWEETVLSKEEIREIAIEAIKDEDWSVPPEVLRQIELRVVAKAQAEITWHSRDKEVKEAEQRGIRKERRTIGTFLEESMETFYAIYRDSAGEQTYTMARHALDKIIKTLKAGQSFNPKEWGVEKK